MQFEPIAVVGRGCVLPGALDPGSLWEAVVEGRDLLGPAPPGRWRLDPDLALAPGKRPDRAWSDRGGHVRGFAEAFDPRGFALPVEDVLVLDPLAQWLLHASREALREAGHHGRGDRVGAVLGNLSFPSAGLARFAEGLLRGNGGGRPADRFMSGAPAHLTARALGLGAGAFALDAACASSFYALELACRRLHDRRADLMLAGAVAGADDLFIHVGFCALEALSRSGRSRPFHRDADGLVPAEGAAVLALKRLSDAVAAGDRVLGVLRGIGLANDGRGPGLLAPAEEGQRRAMEIAYRSAELTPRDISLLECHATGTPVGDATEVRSTASVYTGCRDVPIGSIKSNLGHLITAAGAAGLIKVLAAFAAGIRPPTRDADAPLEALASSPFRLLAAAEPWAAEEPRRAALSAFGFGGNDAHVLVEEWVGQRFDRVAVAVGAPAGPVAIVGLGALVADGSDAGDLAAAIADGHSRIRQRAGGTHSGHADAVVLDAARLRFPPRDLAHTLGQQLLLLRAAEQACDEAGALPRERTSVVVGMQADAEVARHGARWRSAQWRREGQAAPEPDALFPALDAPAVVGCMPNIVANRLNSHLDLAGPSFTTSSEELSGLDALDAAVRALRAGEIDAALVGAVDLCAEPVHEAAAAAVLGRERHPAGDAAVVLALERLDDARRAGKTVLAVLDGEADAGEEVLSGTTLAGRLGHAHAASGLVHVAAAALACRHALRVRPGPAAPWLSRRRTVRVEAQAFTGPTASVRVGSAGPARGLPGAPRLHVYAGADRRDLVAALRAGHESIAGPARLAYLARGEDERRARLERAREVMERGGTAPGIFVRERPIAGELSFVFTAPAGAYAGMGRDLLLALPGLGEALFDRFPGADDAWAWAHVPREPGAEDKLWGSSVLCQLHAELSQGLFGLRPQASIGFCSGETNALYALGAWTEPDALRADIVRAEVYTRELAGAFEVVQRTWGTPRVDWTGFRVLAPVDAVRDALEREPRVHLTIVNAPGDVVIAGDAAGCARVVERVGAGRARPLGYDIAVHCPEMAGFRAAWRALHDRPTRPVPGVRFYTHAWDGAYQPTRELAADALTGQACRTVDFPRLVERAYADGVRIFLEHGPQGGCARWISRILGEREHLAVSLDLAGESSLDQALAAAAQLIVAGVEVDVKRLGDALGWEAPPRPTPARPLRLPVHPPAVPAPRAQVMAPAPPLPPVLEVGAPPVEVAASLTAAAARDDATPEVARHPALAAVLAQQTRVAAVHRAFLEQQARAQQQFLALRRLPGAPLARSAARPVLAQDSSATPRPAAALPREPAPTPAAPAAAAISGPAFDRRQLEVLASGRISSVFGPLFERQDGFRRQVRMPEPPLLLADRVLGIEGEPGTMGKGTIWTETDVVRGAWYLHADHIPAGVMIEAGQADLLLISWLGVDFLNQGERIYRLLGCELTYRGGLPVRGDTLRYDIHVDGHAVEGSGVRLFFFHYDCRVGGAVRLSVRHGQAGFFTDAELAGTGGVLWSAASVDPGPGRVDAPVVPLVPARLDREALHAFSEGRVLDAFGPGFERGATHVETPRIAGGRMLLLHEVETLDPRGGPWGRGHLRAVWRFRPDDWFFEGHFKDDPCMPGTLMFEGCLQAMAVYLTAHGYTLERDAWRFEPVPDVAYKLRCRGQAVPTSRVLAYELFVRELTGGPEPTLFADLLCTVDGVKAFHCERMGLRLRPDWPLSRRPELLQGLPRTAAAFDDAALLACAWGPPTASFGELYRDFDGPRRWPRLPAPPYHVLSRVPRHDGELGSTRPGQSLVAEYDVPADAWYFAENGHPTMPFAVLLETQLQPCGFLALATGIPRQTTAGLHFRNLDGTGTLLCEVRPGDRRITTRVRLTDVSASAGMWLCSFEVDGDVDGRPLFRIQTGFGFFPAEALAAQAGLPAGEEEAAWLTRESEVELDLPALLGRPARIGRDRLRLLDRITGYWPTAGPARLGRFRAEKDVEPRAWFFQAHFHQDPVQPGSLGLEALLQLLQLAMLQRGLDQGIDRPRFLPLGLGETLVWKYRGQVLPHHRRITFELELTGEGRDEGGAWARADGWLWVDGTRIYAARDLTQRIAPAGGDRGE